MKQTLTFFASLLLALAIPHSAKAYDFSAVAPTGQTLYYNIVDGGVEVTSQSTSYPYYTTSPTGALTIPSSVTYNGTTYTVTSIGNYAFQYCSTLTSVAIPDGVTSIGGNAFYGCSGLTSVTIGSGVTTIGGYAFGYCSGLTSVTIGSGVTLIGEYAFYSCSGLTSVTIPDGVTSIGISAFAGVRHIEYHGSATGRPWGAFFMNGVTEGDFVYSDGTMHYLLAYVGTGGDVTIPSTVNTIGQSAFRNCSGLTSVTIPDGVTSICEDAFYNCRGLTSVTIGSGVTSIGGGAFCNCSGLTAVYFNADSCASVFQNAFSSCPNINSFIFGNSVRFIPAYICYNMTNLTAVTIPDGVTSIGYGAFQNCSGLTSVTIGSGVTSIGERAFYFCSGLNEITCRSSIAPSLGTDAFKNVSTSIPINIPCGSSMSYYSRWSYFSNFVEAAAFTFSATTADTNMGSVIVLAQPTCTAPTAVIHAVANDGYRFLRWSNGVTDNPYSLTVTTDTTLTALFTTTEGIDGIDMVNAKVYQSNGNIVVEGAEGKTVTLYDANGRVLATKHYEYTSLRFDIPVSGTYMIKVGSLPARRVVVIK